MKNIYTIDLSKDKSKINEYISETLITKIEESIKNSKKVILYLNKRGSYNLLICGDCNNLKKCPRCDIALSVHENPEKLLCHHCSYSEFIPLNCDKCN
jgi:primosomal protein N' (replication factor Y) (superfamily II helicase)